MSTGTIKAIIEGKEGKPPFGFIVPDDQKPGDKDLYFNEESLGGVTMSEFKKDDKVSYDVESAEKGPKAVNVKKI